MSVIEGYQIQGILAKGGMATIYIALQKSLKRQVALKILNPRLDDKILTLFLDESRIIASLKHPNIIPVYDVGRIGIHFYHSMEYLEGGSLESKIAKGLDKYSALEIILELSEALYLVHSKGLVHGDIKPANVVFRSNDCPVLIDFGITRLVKVTKVASKQSNDIIASPSYAAPEVMRGKAFNHKADIYSLGIMLYEMLTGKKPYTGASNAEIVANSIRQVIPRLPPDVKSLQALFDHMLAKDHHQRIDDARVISRYIKNFLREHPNPAKTKVTTKKQSAKKLSGKNAAQNPEKDFDKNKVVVEYVSEKKGFGFLSAKTLLPLLIVLLAIDIGFAIWYFIL